MKLAGSMCWCQGQPHRDGGHEIMPKTVQIRIKDGPGNPAVTSSLGPTCTQVRVVQRLSVCVPRRPPTPKHLVPGRAATHRHPAPSLN